eukprot:4014715-Pyramimonas_sp.AAC.1
MLTLRRGRWCLLLLGPWQQLTRIKTGMHYIVPFVRPRWACQLHSQGDPTAAATWTPPQGFFPTRRIDYIAAPLTTMSCIHDVLVNRTVELAISRPDHYLVQLSVNIPIEHEHVS